MKSISALLIIYFFLIFFPLLSYATIKYGTDSIYNVDNRVLISQKTNETSPQIQTLAKSVALIFNSDDLITDHGDLLIFANLLQDPPPIGINVCSNERFAEHHAYKSACSGFLVADDLLATAGHCFDSQFSCNNKLIAFDVDEDSEITRGFQTNKNNIFHCKAIVAHVHEKESLQDYAVIRLDRKTNRTPLKIRKRGKISSKDQIVLIGHPLGLPLVYSPNAVIIENSNPLFFKTRVNSFHGNSGSPIINASTFQVEGILVRGQEDLETDVTNKCQRYKKYSSTNAQDKLKGEDVTRIKYILPFLFNNIKDH